MREITQKALLYKNLGFSIIPIGLIMFDKEGKKKINYPIAWKKYQEQIATEEEITEWFEEKQYPNIGILTGKISSLFVLDTDSYKPKYDKALIDSFNLPITPCQKTGRGGRQYFFRYYGNARNAVGAFKEDSGIDIRANGGMVIVPPSKTPLGEYAWEISPEDELCAPLPEIVENHINLHSKKDFHEMVDQKEGTRDSYIYKIGAKIIYILPQEKWDSEVFPVMEALNKTYKPPLSKSDILRIYHSLCQKERKRRGEDEIKKEPYKPSIPYKLFMETAFPAARFAIEPFFERETLNMVSAPPNTWKSWIMLIFALSMAKGTKAFNTFNAEKLGVMVVNEEDSSAGVQSRIKALGGLSASSADLSEDLPLWFRIMYGGKLTKEYIESLLVEIKEKNINVVLFDSLRAIHNAEENDSTAMQGIMDMLNILTREGITVIFTHHHRKKSLFQKSSDDPEMARGSSAISAALSGHISLEEKEREGKKYLIIRHLKSKVCEKREPFEVSIEVNNATGSVSFSFAGDMKTNDKKLMETKDAIYELLESEKRWMSRKEFIMACPFISDRTFKTALLELEKENNIVSSTRKQLREQKIAVVSEGKGNEKLYIIGDSSSEPVFGEEEDDIF